MPTNRRRRLPRRRTDLSRELGYSLEYELIDGLPMFPFERFADLDEMRIAWQIHRDDLIAKVQEKHPGHRPFAWWLFEGVKRYGERPIIDPTALPRKELTGRETWGILHEHCYPPLQEIDGEFLRRVGEIGDDEWEDGAAEYAWRERQECIRWLAGMKHGFTMPEPADGVDYPVDFLIGGEP